METSHTSVLEQKSTIGHKIKHLWMGLTSAWRAGELEDRSAELSYLKNREKAMI